MFYVYISAPWDTNTDKNRKNHVKFSNIIFASESSQYDLQEELPTLMTLRTDLHF